MAILYREVIIIIIIIKLFVYVHVWFCRYMKTDTVRSIQFNSHLVRRLTYGIEFRNVDSMPFTLDLLNPKYDKKIYDIPMTSKIASHDNKTNVVLVVLQNS